MLGADQPSPDLISRVVPKWQSILSLSETSFTGDPFSKLLLTQKCAIRFLIKELGHTSKQGPFFQGASMMEAEAKKH